MRDTCVACGGARYGVARTCAGPVPCDVLRCKQCGLLYRAIPSSDLFSKSPCGNPLYHQRVAAARRRLWRDILPKLEDYRLTNRILDIGAGRGYFLDNARTAGWETEGIDPSVTDSRYAKEVLGLNVRMGSFEPGIFSAGAYDAVTLWNVLDHIPDPLAALKEAHRLLRRGGVAAVRVPNGTLHLIAHRLSLLSGRTDVSVFPNYSFSLKSLKNIFSAAGFSRYRIWNSVPSSGDPYRLFDALGSRLVDRIKLSVFRVSQGLYYLSNRRIILAPSVLAFAWKE